MKYFWNNHKHTIKYSTLFAFLGSVIFGIYFITIIFFFDFIYDRFDGPTYQFLKIQNFVINWRGFYIPTAIVFIYLVIPCIIGGIVLNHYSQKDLKSGRKISNHSVRRGTLVGIISGLLISTPFVVIMVDGDWKTIFGSFILSLGFGALLIATTIAGSFGYFIHQINAKTYKTTEITETI